jgi:predicted transcriptional regulator of viral defense system
MPKRESLSEYVDRLQSKGKYWFSKEEARKVSRDKDSALKTSLWRLEKKHRIARVRRGFYVIIPLEYSAQGIIPPDWFINDLMKFIGKPYYVGLLSAAAIHGAAHQQPQEFQVIVPEETRKIRLGRLQIRFFRKSGAGRAAVEHTKTTTGYMKVANPAVTALDLVTYSKQVGGLDRAATVIDGLKESLDPKALLAAAQNESSFASIQRLGWLLEKLGAQDKVIPLQQYLKRKNPWYVGLDSELPKGGFPRDPRWRIIVNTEVESEI